MTAEARPRLSLILPAFNEAARLPGTIRRVEAYFGNRLAETEVIVVDDGSTDGTGRGAEELSATRPWLRVLRQHANRGKGAAVRRGVQDARAEDLIAFLDADLTIPVELLHDLTTRVRQGGADIAIASRFVRGSRNRRPLIRRAMGRGFRFFVKLLVPTGLEDTQCGGKVYRSDAARYLFARQRLDGFCFDAEVLFIARREGLRVVEVPFELVQERRTSLHLLKEGLRMLSDLVQIRVNAALGRYR
jgi:dolichyl-phosphate beta-glucosyltransferase